MDKARTTLSDVRARRMKSELDAKSYWNAVQEARAHDAWRRWGVNALLALGLAHLLAGVITFFAANWQAIPAFGKLGLIGGVLIITALTALRLGLDRIAGQALLISASVLVGVWLAVFGQIYQTGADAYDLFLTWVVLIAPWVVISRNVVMWVLALTLAILGLWLYTYQDVTLTGRANFKEMNTAIMALQLGFLAIAEGLRERGEDWLRPTWPRALLALSVAGHADYMAIRILASADLGQVIMLPAPFITLALLTWLYWPRARGIAGFTVMVIGWAVFLSACAIRLLSEAVEGWPFIIALAAIAVLTTASSAYVLNARLKGAI